MPQPLVGGLSEEEGPRRAERAAPLGQVWREMESVKVAREGKWKETMPWGTKPLECQSIGGFFLF